MRKNSIIATRVDPQLRARLAQLALECGYTRAGGDPCLSKAMRFAIQVGMRVLDAQGQQTTEGTDDER